MDQIKYLNVKVGRGCRDLTKTVPDGQRTSLGINLEKPANEWRLVLPASLTTSVLRYLPSCAKQATARCETAHCLETTFAANGPDG